MSAHQRTSMLRLPFRARLAGAAAIAAACLGSVPASYAATIATFPAPSILENLAIDPAGNLLVTDVGRGTIYEVTPAGTSGVFGQVPAPNPAAGIGLDIDGSVIVAGGTSVYRIAPNGSASVAANVAGAVQLNGLTPFRPGVFLVADSGAGKVWQVDVGTGQSQVWSADPRLAPVAGAQTPTGANGIKVFNGSAYVSNSSSATVLRIPILSDGTAGVPVVYASSLVLDDFAFATDGTLFGATQTGNSVVALKPDGTLLTVATASDGLLGDAALAFGRTAADSQSIYVVNNGGAFFGLPGGPQDGSIVRLPVGVSGAAIVAQAVPEPATAALLGGAMLLLLLPAARQSRRTGSGSKGNMAESVKQGSRRG